MREHSEMANARQDPSDRHTDPTRSADARAVEECRCALACPKEEKPGLHAQLILEMAASRSRRHSNTSDATALVSSSFRLLAPFVRLR